MRFFFAVAVYECLVVVETDVVCQGVECVLAWGDVVLLVLPYTSQGDGAYVCACSALNVHGQIFKVAFYNNLAHSNLFYGFF